MDIRLWFNSKMEINDFSIPRYFILKKTGLAEWQYNVKDLNDFIIIGTIKMNSKNSFKLLISKNINDNEKIYNFKSSKYNQTNIPILKSNLQKVLEEIKLKLH